MEKQKKVIDSSVIVKWYAKEEDFEKAIKLKEEYLSEKIILIAPSLVMIEVLNAMKYKKENNIPLEKINNSLWEMQLNIEGINESTLNKTSEIALKYNISIYDALYVTIAQLHGCPLITADKGLYGIPNVIPLEKT